MTHSKACGYAVLGVTVGGASRCEQREHHYRLAEPHVIGETATEAEPSQEVEPAERFPLVLAQSSGKRFRRIQRMDAAETPQLRAGARERLVDDQHPVGCALNGLDQQGRVDIAHGCHRTDAAPLASQIRDQGHL